MASRRVSVYGKKAGASSVRAAQHYVASKLWQEVSDASQSSTDGAEEEDEENITVNTGGRGAGQGQVGIGGASKAHKQQPTVPRISTDALQLEPRRAASKTRVSDSGINTRRKSAAEEGGSAGAGAGGGGTGRVLRERSSFPPRGRRVEEEVEEDVEVFAGNDEERYEEGQEENQLEYTEDLADEQAVAAATKQKSANPFDFEPSSSGTSISPPKKANKRRSGERVTSVAADSRVDDDIEPSSPSVEPPPAKMRELQFYRHTALPTAVKIQKTAPQPAQQQQQSTRSRGGKQSSTRGGTTKGRGTSTGNNASRPQLQFAASSSQQQQPKANPAARVKMPSEPIPSLPGDLHSFSSASDKENISASGYAPSPFYESEYTSSSQLGASDKENIEPALDEVIRGNNAHLYSDDLDKDGFSSPTRRLEIEVEEEELGWDEEEGDLESPTWFVSTAGGGGGLVPGPGPGRW